MNPLSAALQVRYPRIAEALETPFGPTLRKLVCQALGLPWEADDRAILRSYREADDDRHATLREIEGDL